MIAVTCQHCSARYKLSDDLYDKKGVGFGVIVTCRHCKAEMFVRRAGETSVPPLAGTGTAPAIPRAPRPPKPQSLPPPALALTKRKRHASNLGPPTHDGAALPEVVVDLSDLEAAEPTDLEPERTPPRSRSPVPVALPESEVAPSAPSRGGWFAALALLGAGAAGVFGFLLRGALPVNSPSAAPAETVLRTLEPPGPTTPEPGDVALDERAEDEPRAARPTPRPTPIAKAGDAPLAEPEAADPSDDEASDAGASEDGGTEETEGSEPAAPAGPFDRAAASAALGRAASEASACRRDGDPSGMAAVTITYSPSGRVTTATVAGPPFSGTPTGGCIAATFRKAMIPPFEGELVTVKKTVTIQ